jgi:hypothetical protein
MFAETRMMFRSGMMQERVQPLARAPEGRYPMRIVADPATFDPRELERARHLSGYGCIRCGCTIVQYCQDGDDGGLFLLCPPCVTALRTMADGDRVLAVLLAHPLPRQEGFDRRPYPYVEAFAIPDTHFVRGITMRRTIMPIVFGGAPVLSLEQPEAYGGAVRLTVQLGAGGDAPETLVRYSQWLGSEGGWRFEQRPGRYLFSHAGGEAMLALTFAGDGAIGIEALRSRIGAHVLEIDAAGARLDGADIAIPSGDLQLVGVTLPTR